MSLTEAPYTGSIQSTYNYIFSSSPNDLIYDVQPYCVNMGREKIADEGASNANEGYSEIQNSQYITEIKKLEHIFTSEHKTIYNNDSHNNDVVLSGDEVNYLMTCLQMIP